MPVSRCPLCHRGRAGYLDGEKDVHELTDAEVSTEIEKLQAKGTRIRNYMEELRTAVRIPENFPEGAACPSCQQGWREFQDHRKDLQQLSSAEAQSALASNTRWLNALRER